MHPLSSIFLFGFNVAVTSSLCLVAAIASDTQQASKTASEAAPTAVQNDNQKTQLEKGDQENPLIIAGTVLGTDGQPAAGAVVRARHPWTKLDLSTTTDTSGAFSLKVKHREGIEWQLGISAASADGLQLWYHSTTPGSSVAELKSMTVQLESVRESQVRVTNGQGNGIPSSNVVWQLNFLNNVRATTDTDGLARIKVPASAEIHAVVAWKNHEGLNYKVYSLPRGQENDQLAAKPEFPWEQGETLSLDGAQPLTVKLADRKGVPLADIETYVWRLQKEPQGNDLNFSGFSDHFMESSDDTGQVTFNWFPAWQKSATVVWSNSREFVPSRIEYDPTIHNGTVEAQLERLVPLRGKVTFPAGPPAEGVSVTALGAGYSSDRFRGTAMTDRAGRYEIMAAPNQIYMLSITDKQWAAASQSGFAVLPDQEVEEHDFVLKRATRVFGRVLNESTGQVVPGHGFRLFELGVNLNLMGNDSLPNPSNSSTWVCPIREIIVNSDRDGQYEVFLSAGDYRLNMHHDAPLFTLQSDEAEKQVDIQVKGDSRVKAIFKGLVVDEANNPVPAAKIQATSRDFLHFDDWRATTDKDGQFQVQQYAEATYVHVMNPSQSQGAMVEVSKDDTEVTVKLSSTGQASGSLLTEDGSQPAVGIKLDFGVRTQDLAKKMFSYRFGSSVTTDASGKFTLPNLVPGWEYKCTLADHPGGMLLTVAKVQVEPGQSIDLGDLKMPKAPEPYREPTLQEQIETAFNVTGSPLRRFEKAKQRVQNVNQNLLVVFAHPTDARVHALMQVRFEDPDFRSLSEDFLFMAIPTDNQRLDAAQELASAMKLSPLDESAEFQLVVLNRDGSIVAQLNAEQLCDVEVFSKTRFIGELEKHRTVPLDARQLLDEALATAARENKRVLVQETATWCGPCHMLSRFLEANRQWEQDYVWVKMDHRWTGAVEIMQQMRDSADGGIPWFAILDSDGKKLATSNLPESGDNIGFPSSDQGREHFSSMLRSTRQRMSDKEIEELVAATVKQ